MNRIVKNNSSLIDKEAKLRGAGLQANEILKTMNYFK